MPYFTIETVVSVAARHLIAAGRAPDAENAANQLLQESITGQLAPVPEETDVKPAVLFDIFLSYSSTRMCQISVGS